MIKSIYSSIPTFRSLTFKTGLNVLLADTQPDSTEKQTRNSAGKTSFIEIIHFLMGANCHKGSLFRTDALIEHTFTGTFLIGKTNFTVLRGGAEPSKIFILEGGEGRSGLPIRTDKASGGLFVSNVNWRIFLGQTMFGIPSETAGTVYEESGSPSFRAMFSYFVRRRNSGGFLYPERQAEQQQRGDWQVNLSYLLGLDWQIPLEFQQVRKRERNLEELKKAAKSGAFGELMGTVAELRPQVTIAETQAEKLKTQLANFEVLDSYRDLSRRAARAKTTMQTLGRESVSLNETLEHLQRAQAAEIPPGHADLERLYSAAGIELPGVAIRRFEEVRHFYDSVIRNRKTHLQQEIAETKQRISDCEERMAILDNERRDILKTLEGHGALEDFIDLQQNLAALEASAATLRERYKAAEVLEGESIQLDIDRINLKRRLQVDHQHRKASLDEVILLISDTINELYDDRTGRFVVEATTNGPEFRISIEGDRGGGISNIEIFCLDLALLQVVAKRHGGPGFLVHDSHLFDGVDARQIARALLLGQQAAEKNGLQYIVTMNSDIFAGLPLSEEIDREDTVLRTRLSDNSDTGGLFGFRFE